MADKKRWEREETWAALLCSTHGDGASNEVDPLTAKTTKEKKIKQTKGVAQSEKSYGEKSRLKIEKEPTLC